MHLIDSPNATPTNQFTDGDPATALPATEVWSKWLNMMQAEPAAVVLAAGLSLDDGDNTQLLQAITAMLNAQRIAFAGYFVGDLRRTRMVNNFTTPYTVKLGGAKYMVKDKLAIWNSELTSPQMTAAMLGEAIQPDTLYHLYLVYSAITTEIPITNAALVWSTIAPSYDHAEKGYYNGDDRCIHSMRTNDTPDDFIEFEHAGRFISPTDGIYDKPWSQITNATWNPQVLSIPTYCNRANVTFEAGPVSYYYAQIFCRPTGKSGAVGMLAAYPYSTGSGHAYDCNPFDVETDINQSIDFRATSGGRANLAIRTNGWYLPDGM